MRYSPDLVFDEWVQFVLAGVFESDERPQIVGAQQRPRLIESIIRVYNLEPLTHHTLQIIFLTGDTLNNDFLNIFF